VERHRLAWLFFTRKTGLLNSRSSKFLHIAAEPCFEPLLRAQLGDGYLTADLFDPKAMIRMDICDIQYPDEAFDFIYCSHVLEHVPDDRTAMAEFFRVLKTGGWAVLNVPITSEVTYEDPSITDPEERLKAFGQKDHVRRYGLDYGDRLRAAGFTVRVFTADSVANEEEVIRMGLPTSGSSSEIYYCTKEVAAS